LGETWLRSHVTVAFAAANGPYRHPYAPHVTMATVQEDALKDFGITIDGSTRYYLLYNGAEVAPASTIGQVAGHAHDLRLRLRTETIQG
jgi:hypothetical protein